MTPHFTEYNARAAINICCHCGMPTTKPIWCDPLCAKWDLLWSKEDFESNKKPTRKAWDTFCLKVYGEKRPKFEW